MDARVDPFDCRQVGAHHRLRVELARANAADDLGGCEPGDVGFGQGENNIRSWNFAPPD